jgi:peroxiredoxin
VPHYQVVTFTNVPLDSLEFGKDHAFVGIHKLLAKGTLFKFTYVSIRYSFLASNEKLKKLRIEPSANTDTRLDLSA